MVQGQTQALAQALDRVGDPFSFFNQPMTSAALGAVQGASQAVGKEAQSKQTDQQKALATAMGYQQAQLQLQETQAKTEQAQQKAAQEAIKTQMQGAPLIEQIGPPAPVQPAPIGNFQGSIDEARALAQQVAGSFKDPRMEQLVETIQKHLEQATKSREAAESGRIGGPLGALLNVLAVPTLGLISQRTFGGTSRSDVLQAQQNENTALQFAVQMAPLLGRDAALQERVFEEIFKSKTQAGKAKIDIEAEYYKTKARETAQEPFRVAAERRKAIQDQEDARAKEEADQRKWQREQGISGLTGPGLEAFLGASSVLSDFMSTVEPASRDVMQALFTPVLDPEMKIHSSQEFQQAVDQAYQTAVDTGFDPALIGDRMRSGIGAVEEHLSRIPSDSPVDSERRLGVQRLKSRLQNTLSAFLTRHNIVLRDTAAAREGAKPTAEDSFLIEEMRKRSQKARANVPDAVLASLVIKVRRGKELSASERLWAAAIGIDGKELQEIAKRYQKEATVTKADTSLIDKLSGFLDLPKVRVALGPGTTAPNVLYTIDELVKMFKEGMTLKVDSKRGSVDLSWPGEKGPRYSMSMYGDPFYRGARELAKLFKAGVTDYKSLLQATK